MTLRDQIQHVIDDEPVAIFMKGTPERPACGNSMRALQALWNAGAPITAVDVLPDPQIRQELSALTDWPTIPQVFVKGELLGGRRHHRGALRLRRARAQARRRARRRARAGREDRRYRVRRLMPRRDG